MNLYIIFYYIIPLYCHLNERNYFLKRIHIVMKEKSGRRLVEVSKTLNKQDLKSNKLLNRSINKEPFIYLFFAYSTTTNLLKHVPVRWFSWFVYYKFRSLLKKPNE